MEFQKHLLPNVKRNSIVERHAGLNPQVQKRLMAYMEMYFRYLRALRDFHLCRTSIEAPDPMAFGFRNDGRIHAVQRRWRAEFTRTA